MTHGQTVRRIRFGRSTLEKDSIDYTLATCGNDHTVRIFSIKVDGITANDRFEQFGKQRMFGEDSLGQEYGSINDFWESNDDRKEWYDTGKNYWDGQPTTIDGVCGGPDYGKLHSMESAYSVKVFKEFVGLLPSTKRAFDVGAGIGRVTKFVLNDVFEEIDLLDQSPVQIEQARKEVPFVKNFYLTGFQDHVFEHKYDCIWLQWFLMYLTDRDLLNILVKCAENCAHDELTGRSGLIVIKENIRSSGGYWVDKEDNSFIRSPTYFAMIFDAAGLEILHKSEQPEWPEDSFEIMMWVLRKKK